MPDEPTTTPNEQQPDVDYVAAIAELKEKSIPREQYTKLKEENAKLLKALINGEALEGVAQDAGPDIDELRKELFSGEAELTNLEYVQKALALREALIAQDKPDPFLPYGEKIAPTDDDIAAANKVAKVLQDCVDYAAGDSSIFTSELQRVMIDAAPARRR